MCGKPWPQDVPTTGLRAVHAGRQGSAAAANRPAAATSTLRDSRQPFMRRRRKALCCSTICNRYRGWQRVASTHAVAMEKLQPCRDLHERTTPAHTSAFPTSSRLLAVCSLASKAAHSGSMTWGKAGERAGEQGLQAGEEPRASNTTVVVSSWRKQSSCPLPASWQYMST